MARPPRVFSAFEVDGQRYERIGQISHRNRFNRIVILNVWRSNCPDCGAPFEYKSTHHPAPDRPVRRCPTCVNPKKQVPRKGVLAPTERVGTIDRVVIPRPIAALDTHAAHEQTARQASRDARLADRMVFQATESARVRRKLAPLIGQPAAPAQGDGKPVFTDR